MYYTRLQSKNNLQKAHNGWLLPLQMHMGGIAAANKNDIDQHAVDTVCALNPNSEYHRPLGESTASLKGPNRCKRFELVAIEVTHGEGIFSINLCISPMHHIMSLN
ncbi:uncharacterized protein [Gossypium hirsutum]|uniref:Uncharacterized protein n=1 Tax=Gossypium hirsutum TaxID=3635 RepID=A0ABM3BV55_GOSHI|nr:uncharacterized protein LOC121230359 [Gossypium hirsutum]